MKKDVHTRTRLRDFHTHVGALLCVGALVILLALWMRGTDASIDAKARAIVAECTKTQGDHSACYEAQVPNFYPQVSVSQLFAIIREIRVLDTSYQFCHVLAHKIGEKVVEANPDGWVDAIPLNPSDGLCSNGFIHGVIGGRFRAEVLSDRTIQTLLPDFTRACMPRSAWQPSSLDRAICYHGMGHLFDFITNANIEAALSLCKKVVPDEHLRTCVQGVFMQIYQPLEPDDYALIAQMPTKPTPSTVRDYCARFRADAMAEGSCIEESWPMQRRGILDGTGVEKLCGWEPNATEREVCYVAMSSIIGRLSLGNTDKVVQACSAFPAEHQGTCFSNSAGAVLEENRADASEAIALCMRAPPDIALGCISSLIGRAQFTFGANRMEYQNFCNALTGADRDTCLASLEKTQ